MSNTPKILLFDIETSPNVAYTWGKYDQNVIDFLQEWHMLSFAYKWKGEKQIKVKALPDYAIYKKDRTNDLSLVQDLWELFNKADIIIAHNGDQFDIKKSNACFLKHSMGVPSHYRTIDTLKVARKQFKLNSNKLDDLATVLKLPGKLKHAGWELWKGCLEGDLNSWKTMRRYNKQDVALLEQVYLRLLPWIDNHPNLNVYLGYDVCPNCGSEHMKSFGFRYAQGTKYRRLQCMDCGSWSKQSLKGKGNISNK